MNSGLSVALRDLADTVSDVKQAPFQAAESLIQRFVSLVDTEPLSGFLLSVLPPFDFAEWWAGNVRPPTGMVGSGTLIWPTDRAERVAAQIGTCRAIANGELKMLNVMHDNYPRMNNLTDMVRGFASQILDPLMRDMIRLTEHHPIAPVLFEAMGRLPQSGDAILDGLLNSACTKFRDPAPAVRREATEKLWDAWERLKSIEGANKQLSITLLLDRATREPTFRRCLEDEARTLTEIGNRFHIRHFETNRIELTTSAHFDYLFHRLYALIHLLLFSRISPQNL